MISTVDSALRASLELGKRIPGLESIIAESPSHSVLYAKDVLRDRFILAEETIASNPYYVCAYLSELNLKKAPENIHRIMLSYGIVSNLDDDKNYWVKQYFKFCDYVDGKENKPWWLSRETVVNWKYGDFCLAEI